MDSDINKSTPFVELMKASWRSVASERLRFFTFIFLFLLGYTLELASPWAIGYVLGVFVEHGVNEYAFNLACVGILYYAGLKFTSLFLHHLARYLQIQVAYTARLYVFNNVFGSFMAYPLSWHVKHHSGDSLSKLHRAAGAVDQCIGNYIWQILEGVSKIIFAGIALAALDHWVALNVFGMSALTLCVVLFFNKRLVPIIRKNNAFVDSLNRVCVDYFFNVVTLKTLGLQQYACERLQKLREHGLAPTREMARIGELKWGTIGIGYSLLIGSSLFIYFHDITFSKKVFDVAQVYVLLNYLDRIFQALGSFTGYYSGLVEASTAYEDASDIILKSQKYQHIEPPQPITKNWGEVATKDLSYSYVKGEARGLHHVDFSFKKGQKIALVGPSGGGKTTLLKVLGGIIETETGSVSVEATTITFPELYRSVLLVPQEPEIFAGTLRENITMGQKYSEEEIRKVFELCRASEILAKLPHGWDTDLAEKGLNLSVGEKQRIALARGLLRIGDRSIVLLDEPTSSLDPATEKALFDGLLSTFKQETIITACHRLSLVPLFDRIVHVKAGKIIEEGTFEEMVRSGGEFSKAWNDFQARSQEVEAQFKSESSKNVSKQATGILQ